MGTTAACNTLQGRVPCSLVETYISEVLAASIFRVEDEEGSSSS
jgi:hypothetical protein